MHTHKGIHTKTHIDKVLIDCWFTVSVLCDQAVKKRPDLKLIVTSATLDAVKFSQYFFEAVSALFCCCWFWCHLSVCLGGGQSIYSCTCSDSLQSSGAVWKLRWLSWAPIPNKLTVSVDIKQHFIRLLTTRNSVFVISAICFIQFHLFPKMLWKKCVCHGQQIRLFNLWFSNLRFTLIWPSGLTVH